MKKIDLTENELKFVHDMSKFIIDMEKIKVEQGELEGPSFWAEVALGIIEKLEKLEEEEGEMPEVQHIWTPRCASGECSVCRERSR